MADKDGEKARGGIMPSLVAIGLLTLVGAGGGAGVGYLIGGNAPVAEPAPADPADAASAEAAPDDVSSDYQAKTSDLTLVPMQPIYTNLFAPKDVWMRLEASLVVDAPAGDEPIDTELLAAQVEADTMAFLRSVQLSQLAGSRGLLHLADDLRTRAKMRSPAVEDYLIRVMVAE